MDEYQRAAVESESQFLQIVGYPGTGKTLVLASRIARLLENGAHPESIVALTFTKSSSLSLRRSVERHLSPEHADKAERVRINTYHSFCQELISEFPQEVGISNEWDMTDFLDIHNIVYYPSADANRHRLANYPNGLTPGHLKETKQLLRDYKTYDFGQALEYGKKIIQTQQHTGLSYLLIDEFQDCTSMQWDLVRAALEANPQIRLTVAGDPNQEIFNFQEDHLDGSFSTMLRELGTDRVDVQYLRYNYRSTQQIIDTFQSIISKNSHASADKRLIATVPDGKEPEIVLYRTAIDEMKGVCDLILNLCTCGSKNSSEGRSNKYRYRDIAILLRTNADVQRYMNSLRQHNISVQQDLGVRGFGIRQKPSVALTLMKWANSPKDFYLSQLLYNRYHKFVLEKDFHILASHQEPFSSEIPPPPPSPSPSSSLAGSDDNQKSLVERLLEHNPKKYDHPFIKQYLPNLRDRLLNSKTPAEITNTVVEALNLWKPMAGSKAKEKYTPAEDLGWQLLLSEFERCNDEIRMEDLPAEEDRVRPGAALSMVIKYIFSGERPKLETGDMVSVDTIHSSKSREWPVVILPSGEQRNGFMFKPNIEDDKRLQYVAASRAKRELYFTNVGPIMPLSRNSFVELRPRDRNPVFLSMAEAVSRDPVVFQPIHAIRRLSRIIKV